jgi:hypothetical protein
MVNDKKSSTDKYGAGGIFIPGGLFVGMGFGFLSGNNAAGIFTWAWNWIHAVRHSCCDAR